MADTHFVGLVSTAELCQDQKFERVYEISPCFSFVHHQQHTISDTESITMHLITIVIVSECLHRKRVQASKPLSGFAQQQMPWRQTHQAAQNRSNSRRDRVPSSFNPASMHSIELIPPNDGKISVRGAVKEHVLECIGNDECHGCSNLKRSCTTGPHAYQTSAALPCRESGSQCAIGGCASSLH